MLASKTKIAQIEVHATVTGDIATSSFFTFFTLVTFFILVILVNFFFCNHQTELISGVCVCLCPSGEMIGHTVSQTQQANDGHQVDSAQ